MASSKPAPAQTSQTTKTEPWGGAVPYMTGQQGIFPKAQEYFTRFQAPTPQSQEVSDYYQNVLKNRYGEISRGASNLSNRFLGGEFDPTGMTRGQTAVATPAQSYTSNLVNQMRSLGGANPQAALQQMLSGQIDNPYLQQLQQANINTSRRGYEDMIQSLKQQVMPDIGNQAFASGGYGGSRQGIAEGLALQQAEKNARDLGISAMDYGTQLYGGAYENAQQRMAQAANLMTGQAAAQGQFNAAQQQQAALENAQALNQMGQFNAQALQNAEQFNRNLNLQQQAARAQNLMQGVGLYEKGTSMADNIYNQLQAIYGMPQNAYQQALAQYANIISPGAGAGGTSSTVGQVPIYNNNMGQILGGASSVAGLLGSLRGG